MLSRVCWVNWELKERRVNMVILVHWYERPLSK